jgi:hypothetical protein
VGDESASPDRSQSESERLQAESNRNRLDFLRAELETCSTLAKLAEFEQESGDPEHAARSLEHAETGYATLVRFMSDPKHAKHISDEQRRELRAEMERIRAVQDRLARRRQRARG